MIKSTMKYRILMKLTLFHHRPPLHTHPLPPLPNLLNDPSMANNRPSLQELMKRKRVAKNLELFLL